MGRLSVARGMPEFSGRRILRINEQADSQKTNDEKVGYGWQSLGKTRVTVS